jgi:hypothetical protein
MLEPVLKRFEEPDAVRTFEEGKFELVRIGGMTIARATYETRPRGGARRRNVCLDPTAGLSSTIYCAAAPSRYCMHSTCCGSTARTCERAPWWTGNGSCDQSCRSEGPPSYMPSKSSGMAWSSSAWPALRTWRGSWPSTRRGRMAKNGLRSGIPAIRSTKAGKSCLRTEPDRE